MLASVAAHPVSFAVNPRDVVVAIIGGTMLTLALTRPRLRWVERLTDDSESHRLWAERALTLFAFAMAGYAYDALVMVLQKQLGPQVDELLGGAGVFLVIYAWLSHFEPFVREWRIRGGLAAGVLYTGVMVLAVAIGAMAAETILFSVTVLRVAVLLVAGAFAFVCWLVYRFAAPFESVMDRIVPNRASNPSAKPETDAAPANNK